MDPALAQYLADLARWHADEVARVTGGAHTNSGGNGGGTPPPPPPPKIV